MSGRVVSLLGLFLVLAVGLPAQQTGATMRVNATRVRLRSGASVDSAVVKELAKGTAVTVLATSSNWAKVRVQGQSPTGWIRSDLLIAASPGMTPADAAASNGSSNMSNPPLPPPPPSTMVATPPPPPPPASTMPPPASKSTKAPPASKTIKTPASKPTKAPPPPPKASSSSASHASSGQHGGLVLFGGLTSFKEKETGLDAVTFGSSSGFAAGFGILAPIGGHLGIELDLAYLQTGFSSPSGSPTSFTEHTNTASGSFVLRPVFGTGSAKFFLVGGGYGRFAITCTDNDTAAGPCKITKDDNRFGYGAELGGGIMFGRLMVQGRYDIGMANLRNVSGETVKSSGFIISAGFIL